MTPSHKGGVAEAAITAEAVKAGALVFRPVLDGGRYDLIFDVEGRLLRVQCKWSCRKGDVIVVNTRTTRLTPRGYLRTTYDASQVDALATYCAELDRCYVLPIEDVAGKQVVHLRLAPAANGQEGRDKVCGELRTPWGY